MKLNSSKLNSLLNLEDETPGLMLATLAIYSQSPNIIKSLFSKNNLSMLNIKNILEKEGLLTNQDRLSLDKAINSTAPIDQKDNTSRIVEEIIDNLNKVSDNNYRSKSNSTKSLVMAKINAGFSIEDFKLVNLYFAKLWNIKPEMKKYIRPSTLYNTKFEERVETAKAFSSSYKKHEKDLNIIANFIFSPITSINSPLLPTNNCPESFLDHFSLSALELLIHWLDLNYDPIVLAETIVTSVNTWAKKPNLVALISIEKVLDEKFPTRVAAAKQIINKNSASEDFINS